MELTQFSIIILFIIGYLIDVIADSFRKKKVNYDTYIKSAKWRRTRIKRLRIDKWRCQRCDANLKIVTPNVHHKTYKRLGHERMSDLESLCVPCHKKEHQK